MRWQCVLQCGNGLGINLWTGWDGVTVQQIKLSMENSMSPMVESLRVHVSVALDAYA